MQRRNWLAACATLTIISIAGCAANIRAAGQNGLKITPSEQYSGRISLAIEADANSPTTQGASFSGSFELRGNPESGELDLLTPLGQIAAQLRWQPGLAQIIRASDRQTYPSAQALLREATGASISLDQLFAWLSADTSLKSGSNGDWQVDLSARAQGRITARRSLPTPAVLRIILEQP